MLDKREMVWPLVVPRVESSAGGGSPYCLSSNISPCGGGDNVSLGGSVALGFEGRSLSKIHVQLYLWSSIVFDDEFTYEFPTVSETCRCGRRHR